MKILISKKALSEIEKELNAHPGIETGGMLLGRRLGKDIVLARQIGPGPKAKHHAFSFSYDKEYQQNEYDGLLKENFLLELQGWWHSHLHGQTPSSIDLDFARGLFNSSEWREWNFNEAIFTISSLKDDSMLMKAYYINENAQAFTEIPYEVVPDEDVRVMLLEDASYPLSKSVFSRAQEIVNLEAFAKKRVAIIGLGSVGSLCAVQLAKCGISNFALVDNDILTVQNISRHQCDLIDLGKYKVDAVKEKILRINPTAVIDVFPVDMLIVSQNDRKDIFDNTDMVIASTDSNTVQFISNHEAVLHKTPALFIGCYEKALSGEIIIYIPRKTPCFNCAVPFRKNRMLKAKHDYSTDTSKIIAEPGLSIHIEYITNLALMLCVSILQGRKSWGYRRFIKPLLPNNIVFVNAGSNSIMFSHPLQIRYGSVKRKCSVCSKRKVSLKLHGYDE